MAPLSVTLQPGKWLAEWFTNRTLTAPAAFVTTEDRVLGNWGVAGPTGLTADNFSIRYRGSFVFAAKTYEFTVKADDGIRLFVDGVTLIDAWKDQASTEYKARQTMTAGEHEIRVEFYEAGGLASVSADWAVYVPPDTQAPVLTDVVVSAISPTSAQVGWKTDDPAPVTVEYGITTAYGQVMAVPSPATIVGLQAGTKYNFRLRSTDAAGNAVVGPNTEFTTATPPPPPPPTMAVDFHVSPTGNDANDGRTRQTAWKTLGKAQASAPAGSRIALWEGGIIKGGFLGDKPFHLTTDIGVHAQIQGAGNISLDIQRWVNWSILPGNGGRISVLPPGTPVETIGPDGEKAGKLQGRGLSFYQCSNGEADVFVDAGTDYGLYLKDTLRSRIMVDASNAGVGVVFAGNCGTGVDRTWVGGDFHDCHRSLANTRLIKGDDSGAVGWGFINSIGGGLLAGWKSWNNWSPGSAAPVAMVGSFDYSGSDGGAGEWYNATDLIIEAGEGWDCEGGFETGGSVGKGCWRNVVRGMRLHGNLGPGTERSGVVGTGQPNNPNPTGKVASPGVLIRSAADCQIELDLDITRASVAFQMYNDPGKYGGAIDRTTVTGFVTRRPGVTPIALSQIPASSSVALVVREP